MNVLFILNDRPSESGRTLNALRLACSISMHSSMYVRIFLIGAATGCAHKHSRSRVESEDVEALLAAVIRHGGDVRLCGTCDEDEVGPTTELIEGATVGSLHELSSWVPEADRLLVF